MVDGFRWRLAEDDGGQGALFDEGPAAWQRGVGEFRGMEFLHVKAKKVINEVPAASRMPFRFTINAYRGCSHACAYCTSPDTPVLMADGSTKPIGAIEVGEFVVGTEDAGRRIVPSRVVAHWWTKRAAMRVRLDNGVALVASPDHRFLTGDGWREVAELNPGSTLARLARCTRGGLIAHSAVNPPQTDLATVVSIEDLGVEIPMVDITTGTGDFIADGVVSHNCFARPTHDYLGLNIGEDFERKIVVKVNAVERVRAEIKSPKWEGDPIAMGTNTDPYQRCEGKYRLTRGIIGALGEARNPFSILTKSTLILRDLDVLVEAAELTDIHTSFSIGTLDDEVWRLTEPGTPRPLKRLEAVRRLNDAGIPCGVLVAPILPGLSDRPEQIEAVVEACVDAGATSIGAIGLHLRPGVREHYMQWLEGARPDLVDLYRERFGARSYQPKSAQQAISRIVGEVLDRRQPRRPRRRFRTAHERDDAASAPDPPRQEHLF